MKTTLLILTSAIMFTSCITQNNSTDYGSNVIYKHKKKHKTDLSMVTENNINENMFVYSNSNDLTNFTK
jgi:protein involved in sex pheromone biosynthesis